MKAIHTILPLAMAAILATSCTQKGEPAYRAAVRAEIVEKTGCKPKDVIFSDCQICETVTYRMELERRKEIYFYRIKVNEKMRDDYLAEKKRTNARLKDESVQADRRLLESLDSLGRANRGILDKVEYYDIRFSARAHIDRLNEYEFRDAHAAMDSRGNIFAMSASQKDLRLGMGRLIPGYENLLKRSRLEDDIRQEYNDRRAAEKVN